MGNLDANYIIIGGASIIILSYLFNLLSQKTSIPSVLMLILLGFVTMLITSEFDVNILKNTSFKTLLSVLGTVGLILIVLEASLDLRLKREKVKPILIALLIAFLGLILTTGVLTAIFILAVKSNFTDAVLHSIPLAIISSAIVIPSITNLIPIKKEFLVYESAFSDILGIMVFYFYKDSLHKTSALAITGGISLKIILTVILSIVVGYVLIIILQKLTTHVKFFLLMAVLFIVYSVGKIEHLSPMLAIMFFGIVINNYKIFFPGMFQKYINSKILDDILHELKVMTAETAFLVRTFFFFIFGMSIDIGSFMNLEAFMLSLLILGAIYLVRIGLFATMVKGESQPQSFIAPRGLISILLFFQIPKEHQTIESYPAVLLIIIIVTSLVMTWSLIKNKKQKAEAIAPVVDDHLNEDDTTSEENSDMDNSEQADPSSSTETNANSVYENPDDAFSYIKPETISEDDDSQNSESGSESSNDENTEDGSNEKTDDTDNDKPNK